MSPQSSNRRRGVAMVEFAFVLPLLMFLALMFIFFGKSMLLKQDVLLSDRQLAWRQAKQLPDETQGPEYGSGFIDQTYFQSKNVTFPAGSPGGGLDGSLQSEQDLVNETISLDQANAGSFAQDVVLSRFPGNVNYTVEIGYPVDAVPLSQFSHNLADRYYRQGIPWQHPEVSIWQATRDHFINTFDDPLVSQTAGGDGGLVNAVRQLYLAGW